MHKKNVDNTENVFIRYLKIIMKNTRVVKIVVSHYNIIDQVQFAN